MANNIFKTIKVRKPKRSTFDLSHSVKLTCDMGELIPFMCEETIPGDTWKNQSNVFLRFAPLMAPVLHKIDVYCHFFFVPWRLIWDEKDFENFFTGGEDGTKGSYDPKTQSTDPIFPRVNLKPAGADPNNYFGVGSLADYLGYPTTDRNKTSYTQVSCLPFRAYQLIYDEYYRDENLIDAVDCSKASGHITSASELRKLMTLRRRAWEKDYFTSALPWTQRGLEQMSPVGTSGSLISTDVEWKGLTGSDAGAQVVSAQTGNHSDLINEYNTLRADSSVEYMSGENLTIDNSNNLKLKNGNVNIDAVFSINDLRRASRIQKWLERAAVGGARYTESLLAHFGVISDDMRIQRPEYLGGGKQSVEISDVLQTSASEVNGTAQGNPAGVGYSLGSTNSFQKTFKERGYIIGILSVMPKPCYSQGLRRNLRYFSKFNYFYPEFAELGEQEIYNYELGLFSDGGEDMEIFGYAPRYAEYKYINDSYHGNFRDNLAYWHLGRFFANRPNLAQDFIECNPRNDIFAVTDENVDHLYVNIINKTMARRPMPYLPDPTLS